MREMQLKCRHCHGAEPHTCSVALSDSEKGKRAVDARERKRKADKRPTDLIDPDKDCRDAGNATPTLAKPQTN
jgi:hypothetical protein